jgi:CRP/FNR family transcriptional regulator, cyclic AMP receptor protein
MSQHFHHRRTAATTPTRDERCIECGSLLVPRNLAFGVIISAEADYVCVKCLRAYRFVGNPPRLTMLVPADISKGRLPTPMTKGTQAFNVQAFLDSGGLSKTIVGYRRGRSIFAQGDTCESVLYIQNGGVKLSVLSTTGSEAVVAMLGRGDFFGEGCLAGQPFRIESATTIMPSTILSIEKEQMVRMLHKQHALLDRFIAHMLSRHIRLEQDLIDQLFNSSEKRLARALLLLARYGNNKKPVRVVPGISQVTLAEMIGTTRSRVNLFMNKFKKLGFIEYTAKIEDGIQVNSSLLSVVLHY